MEFLPRAFAALDAAGAVIRPYFRNAPTTEQKLDESPVTIADREAEACLRDILARDFPDFGIIGEEMPPLHEHRTYVWVIDPIDGTRAFITGRTNFCTLLGLLEDGVPILGFIDQPITGERWWGGRDMPIGFRGPYGGQVGTSAITDLKEAELSATSPSMFSGPRAAQFTRLQQATRRTYWGGDAYAFGLLALGHIDVVAECDLKPWDWAALAPVIKAAGGVVTDWAGAPLTLATADGSILAAANATLHAQALAILAGDLPSTTPE